MNPSLIVADDHPLVLKGLLEFLNENNHNVIASATNGKNALALIKAHEPDIAVLDVRMPFFTGLEIAQQCKEAQLETKIILLTFEKDEKTYNAAKEAGVYAYVLKEFALDEIETCIRSVRDGKTYFSPELISYIEINEALDLLQELTTSELRILRLISKNKTAKEIAEELYVSPRTVEKHKSNIRRKLDLDKAPNSILIWAKDNQKYLS